MIKWRAPEFEYHRKNSGWFLGLIIFATFLGLVALWQKNFLFLIFLIIAALVIYFWAKERPKIIEFTLDKNGLWIRGGFHNYTSFTSFAINKKSLQFKKKSHFSPYLTIIIPEEYTEEARNHLLAFLPEVEYNESAIDALSNILRF